MSPKKSDKWTVNLDLVLENHNGEAITLEELVSELTSVGLKVEVAEEFGPGGGNPNLNLTGDSKTLGNWLLNEYGGLDHGANLQAALNTLCELVECEQIEKSK